MKETTKKEIIIFLVIFGVLVVNSSALASLLVDWPSSPLGTDLTATSTLPDLTRYLYEWGIALGGLAVFISLLIAGFLYITSVGNPQQMADARGRISWALFGLVLLLASWLILNTISPQLTTLPAVQFTPVTARVVLPGECTTADDCVSKETPEIWQKEIKAQFECRMKLVEGREVGYCARKESKKCTGVTVFMRDGLKISATRTLTIDDYCWEVNPPGGVSSRVRFTVTSTTPPNCMGGTLFFFIADNCRDNLLDGGESHTFLHDERGRYIKGFNPHPPNSVKSVKFTSP